MQTQGRTCTKALERVSSSAASVRHARLHAPIFSSCRRDTARGRPWCWMAERYSFRRFAPDKQLRRTRPLCRLHPRAESISHVHMEAISGDFYEPVTAGADAYLLRWILHDWDDAAAVVILTSLR